MDYFLNKNEKKEEDKEIDEMFTPSGQCFVTCPYCNHTRVSPDVRKKEGLGWSIRAGGKPCLEKDR